MTWILGCRQFISWRPAFQADIQARLDWCVKPSAKANHPSSVRIDGGRERTVKSGDVIILDASGTTDPGGNDLTVEWGVYPVDPEVTAQIAIEGSNTKNATFIIAPKLAGKTVPILLSVSDGR